HQPSGASEGRPIPARKERSPTRTSCSRRNDGPGGGSRSGTAASLRGRQDQAGWRSPSVSGSVSSAASTSSSSALTSSRSPTIDSAAAASSGVTSGACPSSVASAIRASASAWRLATSASRARRSISRRTSGSGGASAPTSAAVGVSSGYSPLIQDSSLL